MISVVNFGQSKTGLATVGYKLKPQGSSIGGRVTTNITELGGGCYVGENISATFIGSILWDSGETIPLYSAESLGVTVGVNSDKTGYALSATGLDTIATTAPTGSATTFTLMIVQLWRRFFKKVTTTSTNLVTYADNGTTVITSQTISDDGTTQTQGTS